jgi:hypothetical protein
MCVILDTNILVSALLKPESPPARVAEWALSRKAVLLLSPDLLAEYESVLNRPKFSRSFNEEHLKGLLSAMARESVFIVPFTEVNGCIDASDNKVLALAIDCNADFIITGDDHLLQLHPYGKTEICAPADFLKMF